MFSDEIRKILSEMLEISPETIKPYPNGGWRETSRARLEPFQVERLVKVIVAKQSGSKQGDCGGSQVGNVR